MYKLVWFGLGYCVGCGFSVWGGFRMRDVIECEIIGRLPKDGRITLDRVIVDSLVDGEIYEISLKIRKIDKIYRQKGGRFTKVFS